MTETLEHTETEVVNLIDFMPYDESKDPERRTHIINPPANVHIWQEGMTAKEIVDIARATDQKITALCRYTWVPKHNPEKFDICEPCLAKAHAYIKENGL